MQFNLTFQGYNGSTFCSGYGEDSFGKFTLLGEITEYQEENLDSETNQNNPTNTIKKLKLTKSITLDTNNINLQVYNGIINTCSKKIVGSVTFPN